MKLPVLFIGVNERPGYEASTRHVALYPGSSPTEKEPEYEAARHVCSKCLTIPPDIMCVWPKEAAPIVDYL